MFEHFRMLWKNTMMYGIGYGFTQLANLFLLPLYARYLSVGQFGIMALLMVFISIVSVINEMGIRIALTRIYFDFTDNRRQRELLGTTFIMLLISGILILLLVLPNISTISRIVLGSTQFNYLFLLCTLTLFFDSFFYFHLSIIRIKNRPFHFVMQSFLKFILYVGLTFYFVVELKKGLTGIFEARLMSGLVNFIVSQGFLIREMSFRLNFSMVTEILKFGLPFVPANLFSFVLTSSDRYLLRIFSTLDQVGLYAMGYRIGMCVDVFVNQPFNLAWPQQIKSISEKRKADEIFSRIFTYYFITAGFVLTLIIVFLNEIYSIFLTPEYNESKNLVAIIGASYLLNGTYNILLVGLFLYKKTKYQPLIYGFTAILNIGLNLYFIPRYGMYGAAGTNLFCYALIPILTYFSSKKYYHFKIEYSRILKVILSLTVICISGSAINFQSLTFSSLMKLFIVSLFPLCLYIMSFYDEKEKLKTKEILNRLKYEYL